MRQFSLAYLTAANSSVTQAIDIAHDLGYHGVGLRLWPNAPGAPHQPLLGNATLLAECVARVRDTGVRVMDLEIVRIGPSFDPTVYRPLFDAGASLGACAVLVAGDDPDEPRLAQHFAQLCEFLQPYGMSADLEFMPWTAVPHAQAVK